MIGDALSEADVERLLREHEGKAAGKAAAPFAIALRSLQGHIARRGTLPSQSELFTESRHREVMARSVAVLMGALESDGGGYDKAPFLLDVLPRLWCAAAVAVGLLGDSGGLGRHGAWPVWLRDAVAVLLRPRLLSIGPELWPFFAQLLDSGLLSLAALEHGLVHTLARTRGRGKAEALGRRVLAEIAGVPEAAKITAEGIAKEGARAISNGQPRWWGRPCPRLEAAVGALGDGT